MAQGVRPGVWQRHTQRTQATANKSCQTTASQGPQRSPESQEDLAMGRARPHLSEVVQHGVADGLAEGISSDLPGLGASDEELLPLPVEVLQVEAHDFPGSEAVD